MGLAEKVRSGGAPRRVAVLDDDAGQAQTVRYQLEDVGVEPIIADLDAVPTLNKALHWLNDADAEGLICDVQLNNLHGGMKFDGAQLVARLVTERRFPCVLTTGFPNEVWMLVRPHRSRIPVLLGRDETEDPEALIRGLERCGDEIHQGRPAERQTYRVPLFVERYEPTEHDIALDVRVGGWVHKTPMRFPASMLGDGALAVARTGDLVGKVFFARVNLGASRESDLFLEEPEPTFLDPSALELHFEGDTP